MDVVCFRFAGKFGHFLRAEANANGITYPYTLPAGVKRYVAWGHVANVLLIRE